MDFDPDDIRSAALCAWKEARGEGVDGMRAVLFVLRNRVGSPGFAHSLHEVIYGKNQFTSMSVPSDPEFGLQVSDDDPAFVAAKELATAIFGGASSEDSPAPVDPTKNAHYYANLHEIDSDSWFYKEIVMNSYFHPLTAQIGRHTFFT